MQVKAYRLAVVLFAVIAALVPWPSLAQDAPPRPVMDTIESSPSPKPEQLIDVA
jgi:hypothetical protein